ncbi:class I SAM-dependent DNA methyltransferase [Cellulomonas cellasea]|uniref:site-specific DNA-methyltransferase (adenine-specific) n=1 Tax=Cellulomonas cellasea TaxID=43670 RepID=A0A7W4UKT8_9CELL|nr:DNA methyltransferase [Cellulomonas cellasea]MBB2925550.1 hypothetical protein [Cellulomonas cellasea]
MSTINSVDSAMILAVVDSRDFRRLFIERLGWHNPDHPPLSFDLDSGGAYTFTQVAGYKGLRIWTCPVVPDRRTQRALDALLGQYSTERLVIFADDVRQEWRWPRKTQTGGINAKLMVHPHTRGVHNQSLVTRLAAITIDFDDDVSLVDLLDRMRDAFNAEAETASVQAARLMGRLYTELELSAVPSDAATLLLARLLFLAFADDSDMWVGQPELFKTHLQEHTTDATLHTDLVALFDVLSTDERSRDLPSGSPLTVFRYVNGGLFRDPLTLPRLTSGFRKALLDACTFDWSLISPAVFGSMFQTVKDKAARREGGEHYTTEENILKTIGPLFLDELHDRLDAAWDDRSQLTRLHNDLGRLRVMDPACGCGNFLIVAYRELRALELEVLKRRRQLDLAAGARTKQHLMQGVFEVQSDIKVRLDHFYGIEIDPWPARIAQTALLLVDHLANQQLAEEFGVAPDRLPIRISPAIHLRNALQIDWQTVVPASPDVVIVGNPPFSGDRLATPDQKEDLRRAWDRTTLKHLDYVTGWYAKALAYYGTTPGKWAFVSTNSVAQGEQVAELWGPILLAGWRVRFAHRSFEWLTESSGERAAVHVSIVGFDRARTPAPQLWTYAPGGKAPSQVTRVRHINPYLLDAPTVLVHTHEQPISDLPEVMMGNMPRSKSLVVTAAQYDEVAADPVAARYLRRYLGTEELLSGVERWCLWLVGVPQVEIAASPVLSERVEGSRAERLLSRAESTRKMASTPHLFAQRTQPAGPVLVIPGVSSERRHFLAVGHFDGDVVTSNLVFCAADPDSYGFGILSSSMFMDWMCGVGGRLKSDPRFSKTFNYNAFPLPKAGSGPRAEIVDAALAVQRTRAEFPDSPLESLYNPARMPAALLQMHGELDDAVDALFEVTDRSRIGRQRLLLSRYADMRGSIL